MTLIFWTKHVQPEMISLVKKGVKRQLLPADIRMTGVSWREPVAIQLDVRKMTSRASLVAILKIYISLKQLGLALEMKFQFVGDAKSNMTKISSHQELSTNQGVHGMPDDDFVDWSHVRAAEDPAALPGAVGEMMDAPTSEIAEKAYWRIEGNAFFQRELYQAAEPVTRLVVDRIRSGQWTQYGLGMGLDLLVEVAMGWPALSEQMHGDNTLDQRCRSIITGLLPYLYELLPGLTDERVLTGIVDLTCELEDDRDRRQYVHDCVAPIARGGLLLRGLQDLHATL